MNFWSTIIKVRRNNTQGWNLLPYINYKKFLYYHKLKQKWGTETNTVGGLRHDYGQLDGVESWKGLGENSKEEDTKIQC
jgi:hypothetical protein